MRTLKTGEAAKLLGVSSQVLYAWHRRYGFPTSLPRTGPTGRRWVYAEVIALRDARKENWIISSAIERAKERTGDSSYAQGYRAGYKAALRKVAIHVGALAKEIDQETADGA